MSMATRQSGILLSIFSLCSAFVAGVAPDAVAQPVIPVAPGQVQVTFDGIGDPRSGAAINLSMIKLGQLQSSPGSVLADGSVCPEGGRLNPTGITMVCVNDASLLEWYK